MALDWADELIMLRSPNSLENVRRHKGYPHVIGKDLGTVYPFEVNTSPPSIFISAAPALLSTPEKA